MHSMHTNVFNLRNESLKLIKIQKKIKGQVLFFLLKKKGNGSSKRVSNVKDV